MARYVITAPVVVPFVSYAQPARVLRKGDVVELSAAEVTAIGAGNMRAVVSNVTTGSMPGGAGNRDQLGEAFAASNASP
jgi:hypothetical protein